jgi:hypothetical protein
LRAASTARFAPSPIDNVVRIDEARAVESRKIDILLKAAEHSCVVIQTLRNGTDISVRRDGA